MRTPWRNFWPSNAVWPNCSLTPKRDWKQTAFVSLLERYGERLTSNKKGSCCNWEYGIWLALWGGFLGVSFLTREGQTLCSLQRSHEGWKVWCVQLQKTASKKLAAEIYSLSFSGSKSHSVERWKVCLEVVNDRMGLAVSSLFIKKYFMHDSKTEVSLYSHLCFIFTS